MVCHLKPPRTGTEFLTSKQVAHRDNRGSCVLVTRVGMLWTFSQKCLSARGQNVYLKTSPPSVPGQKNALGRVGPVCALIGNWAQYVQPFSVYIVSGFVWLC